LKGIQKDESWKSNATRNHKTDCNTSPDAHPMQPKHS